MSVKQWALNRAKSKFVSDLQKQSTDTQVAFLRDALRTQVLTASQLKESIKNEAPGQMRKAAEKIMKSGGIPTVDALLGDYNTVPGFKELATDIGLAEEWFRGLAVTECAKWNKGGTPNG